MTNEKYIELLGQVVSMENRADRILSMDQSDITDDIGLILRELINIAKDLADKSYETS